MRIIPIRKAWLGEADCRHCVVRSSVLFAGLEEADFTHIHQPIEDIALEPQTLLYHAGDRGHTIFTLRSGLVKLVQYLPDGGQRIVRLLQNSDVVGLEALLGQPYQHDAFALTACELCAIPVSVVEELDREQPRLHQELMARWQQALTQADVWLTELSTGTARQRVARLLLRLAGSEPDNRLVPLFGREDLGAMLGLTTETVSRVISELRRHEIVQEIEPNLLSCNYEALRHIADGDA